MSMEPTNPFGYIRDQIIYAFVNDSKKAQSHTPLSRLEKMGHYFIIMADWMCSISSTYREKRDQLSKKRGVTIIPTKTPPHPQSTSSRSRNVARKTHQAAPRAMKNLPGGGPQPRPSPGSTASSSSSSSSSHAATAARGRPAAAQPTPAPQPSRSAPAFQPAPQPQPAPAQSRPAAQTPPILQPTLASPQFLGNASDTSLPVLQNPFPKVSIGYAIHEEFWKRISNHPDVKKSPLSGQAWALKATQVVLNKMYQKTINKNYGSSNDHISDFVQILEVDKKLSENQKIANDLGKLQNIASKIEADIKRDINERFPQR